MSTYSSLGYPSSSSTQHQAIRIDHSKAIAVQTFPPTSMDTNNNDTNPYRLNTMQPHPSHHHFQQQQLLHSSSSYPLTSGYSIPISHSRPGSSRNSSDEQVNQDDDGLQAGFNNGSSSSHMGSGGVANGNGGLPGWMNTIPSSSSSPSSSPNPHSLHHGYKRSLGQIQTNTNNGRNGHLSISPSGQRYGQSLGQTHAQTHPHVLAQGRGTTFDHSEDQYESGSSEGDADEGDDSDQDNDQDNELELDLDNDLDQDQDDHPPQSNKPMTKKSKLGNGRRQPGNGNENGETDEGIVGEDGGPRKKPKLTRGSRLVFLLHFNQINSFHSLRLTLPHRLSRRACTVCRRLKMKCIDADLEEKRKCKRCRNGNLDCVFEESQRGKKSSR